MGKLGNLSLKVPTSYESRAFREIISAICNQSDSAAEGRLSSKYSSSSVTPSGSVAAYAVGDIIFDSNVTVRSTVAAGVGLNYVRLGWIWNVAGAPGTFQELRVLTGGGSIAPQTVPQMTVLGGDVALNNTANYFDGPSQSVVAGTGIYYVSGSVTLWDTAAAANFNTKLWDGTTVIASGRNNEQGPVQAQVVHLSGVITNPAGNIRISCKDETNATGVIKFNASGNSKDSTLTVLKIG